MAETGVLDTMPSYITFLQTFYLSLQQYFSFKENKVTIKDYPRIFYNDLAIYAVVETEVIVTTLIFTIALTLLRSLLTKLVFLPMADYFQLSNLNASKFPESAFKTLYYSFTWIICLYLLVISGKYDYFQQPVDIWTDWHPGMSVPLDITLVYCLEFAFYLHSIYSTLYIDRWRKDSLVMLFHHILTMALIGFSYASRYHKIGLLVLFLHDISDICLESTKCHVYFKERGGKYYAIHDILSTVGFICFGSSWFTFRLYWFPLKVLHSAGFGTLEYGPKEQQPSIPFWFFFNTMLWILLVLNLYWFLFILNFIWKVITGQMTEVDDIREEEALAKAEQKNKSKSAPKEYTKNGSSEEAVVNGASSTARHRKKPQLE